MWSAPGCVCFPSEFCFVCYWLVWCFGVFTCYFVLIVLWYCFVIGNLDGFS